MNEYSNVYKSSEGYRRLQFQVFSVDLQVKVLAVSQGFHRRPLDAAEFRSLEQWELVGSSPLKVGNLC